MSLQAEQAEQHFANHSCAPVTLVYGDETLLNLEAVAAWRQRATKDGYLERQRLDGDNGFRWSSLNSELDTPSLFAARRAVELHSEDKKFNKAASDALARLAEHTSDNTRLLIHAPNLNKPQTSSWYKALFNRQNLVIQSKPLYPLALERQIDQRLKRAKLRLTDDAHQRLIDYCQGNLLAAQQAIGRLRIHPECHNIITAELLSDLLADVSHFSVFALSDAFLEGNWLEAWKITGKLREEQANQTTLITWLIQRDMSVLLQLHNLPTAQYSELFKQYRLYSPQQQKRYHQAIKYYSPTRIRNMLKFAAKLDRLSKGGEAGDYWLTLSQYLLLLAQHYHKSR